LKNVTLTGTVTTFGLFEAEPFDTINIEITPRGIDDEFIISKVEYDWARDETTLTVIENRGFDDDILVRLEEKTERIDLQDTDPDAVDTRVVSTDVSARVFADGSIGGSSIQTTTTNDCVDKIAGAWQGNGSINVSEIVLGDTATGVSRSDSSMENQTKSVSSNITVTTPGPREVAFSIFVSEPDVREIGIKSADGTLLARGITESAQNISSNFVTFKFTISDATQDTGVVTINGLSLIQDMIRGANLSLADIYAVGSFNTPPTVSDTSLGSRDDQTLLNRTQVQKFDTNLQMPLISRMIAP
jgi:hypothetical protein